MEVSDDVGPFYDQERSRSRSRSRKTPRNEQREVYEEEDIGLDNAQLISEVQKYKELFLEQLDINYKLKNKLIKMEKRLLKLENIKK